MKKIILVRHGESTENIAMNKGNKYDNNNIILTENGLKQAKITGKFLLETFGAFDKIYSSPATRCIQTAKIILNEMNCKKEININKLLVEFGYKSNILDGLSKEETDKIKEKIKIEFPDKKISSINQLHEKIKNTTNPYDKLNLTRMFALTEKKLKIKPDLIHLAKNHKKFLKKIRNDKEENILIFSHSTCINIIIKLICNIDIFNTELVQPIPNCGICCLSYDNKKYSLVSVISNYLNNN